MEITHFQLVANGYKFGGFEVLRIFLLDLCNPQIVYTNHNKKQQTNSMG
jgi:hypothetical protein